MLRALTFLFLTCIAQTLCGQKYIIPFAQLKDMSFKEDASKHILDLSNGNKTWTEDAKIVITNITEEEAAGIKITLQGDKASMIDTKLATIAGDMAIYPVHPQIEKRKISFDVFIGDGEKPNLTVTFDVREKIKDQTDPSPSDTNRTEDPDSDFESYIGALASANFVGNNKFLKNLTPIVNLGGIIPLVPKTEKGWFSMQLDVNPYVGGDIDTKDSASFIPALMLPGRAGFVFNGYLNFHVAKSMITIMPFGFGLKFIPNLQDSSFTVLQHNIRAGISFRYADDFVLGAVLTQGWHNLTSQSKEDYGKIFTKQATDINYINVSAQLALRGKTGDKTNYVYFEWRSLLSRNAYAPFTNNAILTLGLRKTIELTGVSAILRQSNSNNKGSAKGAKKVHTLF